jgi:hypothetical protein
MERKALGKKKKKTNQPTNQPTTREGNKKWQDWGVLRIDIKKMIFIIIITSSRCNIT